MALRACISALSRPLLPISSIHFPRRFASGRTNLGQGSQGYQDLLTSSDWDKIDKICRTHLGKPATTIFPKQANLVSPIDLQKLVSKVREVTSFPLISLENFEEDVKAIHFRENRIFMNLPYSNKVSAWPDRQALQELIRRRFSDLFQNNDLVIVPGCADGQIPIEISANSEKHDINLNIVAADFNADAMNIGYLTMQSYGLRTDRITWVQADVTKKMFFEWIQNRFPRLGRHQVVTLIQPSLREQSFLSFLKNSSSLAFQSHRVTTVVMPVLFMDANSEWYQRCNNYVESALTVAEKKREAPQFIWSQTKYGVEMLKLNTSKNAYVPEQYFVHPESIAQIQDETGFIDSSGRLFPEVLNSLLIQDPRAIKSSSSKRMLCIWDTKVLE
ncbi:MAG: hypothetical protein KBA81_07045 [Rhabdochlamydiaceae bacterium]|nr:hypothetical protein [Rhabdochlamydiaceae bacterium]